MNMPYFSRNQGNKLDTISTQPEKLDRHIYYLPKQEVWNRRESKQATIENLKQIKEVAQPIQKAVGTELVVSKPIISPHRLQKTFQHNPEEILINIRPLKGHGMPGRYCQDPTMIPVIFNRWGQDFVGLIKIGYARDYLDCEYKPQNQLYLPTSTPSYSYPKTYGSIIPLENRPQPYKVKDFFETQQMRFISKKAQGVYVHVSYDISDYQGERGGQWTLKIKEGTCEIIQGFDPSAKSYVKMSAKTYLKIAMGKLDSRVAFYAWKS